MFLGYSQAPTVDPTTPPVRDAADVISIFSAAYSNISGADYNPNWGQAGWGTANTAYDTGSGNLVLAYPNFNYQGIDFNGAQNVSGMEFLHFDIWTDNGVVPNIYVISSGAEIPHAIPNGDGAWQSIDIAISGITGDPTNAIQFKFDGGNGTTNAIYVDNLYFWKAPADPLTDATLSDLQVESVTIAGFSSGTTEYDYEVPGGTVIVPQITSATTTNVNATVTTITQAPGIPGDATVLVTAEDGVTTETYTVSIVEVGPGTAAPTPPNRAPADVISLFSDAYTDITIDTFDTGWCPATTTSVMVAGNETKEVTGLGCEGVEFITDRFDATAFTHFHMDIYTDTPTLDKSFNVKFSNWNGGGGEANAIEYSGNNGNFLTNPNPGTWISIDLPLSSFTPIVNDDRNDLVQFVISSNLGTVYYDNLYLYKGNPLGTEDFELASFSVYPNPAQDSWTIKTKNQEISSIQVFDILGKNVLSLTPNAREAKIDASGLTTGLYFAQIKTRNGIDSIKLIKQ